MSKQDAPAVPFRPFHWVQIADERPVEKGVSPPLTGGEAAAPDPEALLSAARREADALVAGARAEAVSIREAARREGRAAGEAEARQAAEEGARRWVELAQELSRHKAELFEEARTQVIEFVLTLVGKILGPIAEADREAVVRVTGRALQALSEREVLTIRVNPDDLHTLLDAKSRLLQDFDGIKKLTVVEDPSVGRGGCLVETAMAEIDARLESQLGELVRTLRRP